jgi:hypothetical protein
MESGGLEQGRRKMVEGCCPVMRVQWVMVVDHGGRHCGGLPLGGARAEVRDEAHAQWVGGVQAFHRAQVSGYFG